MKKKISILAGSLAAIAVSASIITGSTYALFTSESEINIAVSSAKIEVSATITDLKYASNSLSGEYDGKWIKATEEDGVWSGTFENQGVVMYNSATNQFDFSNITPGDAVNFTIEIVNKSSVAVKYQTAVSRDKNSHKGFFDALDIKFGGQQMIANGFSGATKTSVWNDMTKEEVISVPVTIVLPYDVEDKIVNGVVTEESIQGKSCSLEFVVSAVQGNASTTDPEENPDYIPIAVSEDLELFRDTVNAGNNYKDKTVKLLNNIDLENEAWLPIGGKVNGVERTFNGKFDGNGYTIKNLNISEGDQYNWGLFGRMYGSNGYASIVNLKVDGVTIGASEYISGSRQGAILASGQFVTLDNIQVTNLDITSDSEAQYLGGLVGHGVAINVSNCSVQGNIATNSAAQVGGMFGFYSVGTISNCHLDLKVDGLHMSWFGGIVANCVEDGTTAIENCYIHLEMTNAGAPMRVGGVMAQAVNGNCNKRRLTVSNCYVTGSFDSYYNGDVSAPYGDAAVRSGLGGLCAQGYGIDFVNCYVNMDVPGGKYLAANCMGDYDTVEVWNLTNCSWKGGPDSYTYYGWQQAPSHEYGTITKEDSIFQADMTYADFLNALNNR